jgi:hypothetical protein
MVVSQEPTDRESTCNQHNKEQWDGLREVISIKSVHCPLPFNPALEFPEYIL